MRRCFRRTRLLVVWGMALPVWGQVLFRADFEPNSKEAVPNAAVNNLESWKPDNPLQTWEISPHPKTKSNALRQGAEGCDKSGNTPLPGNITFTDGIIQLEMSAGDNDSWGVIFRQSGQDKGYVVTFGTNETPAVIVALLEKGCGAVGKCNDQAACENNPANTIIQVPHGLGPIRQDNSQILLGRIEARGEHIRIWYVDKEKVKDPLGNLGNPLVDIRDSTHKSGKVGIWHESMNNSFIDNILVLGPGGLAVQPQGKLAITWATLKPTLLRFQGL